MDKNNSLVPIGSNTLVKVKNSIAITNKILSELKNQSHLFLKFKYDFLELDLGNYFLFLDRDKILISNHKNEFIRLTIFELSTGTILKQNDVKHSIVDYWTKNEGTCNKLGDKILLSFQYDLSCVDDYSLVKIYSIVNIFWIDIDTLTVLKNEKIKNKNWNWIYTLNDNSFAFDQNNHEIIVFDSKGLLINNILKNALIEGTIVFADENIIIEINHYYQTEIDDYDQTFRIPGTDEFIMTLYQTNNLQKLYSLKLELELGTDVESFYDFSPIIKYNTLSNQLLILNFTNDFFQINDVLNGSILKKGFIERKNNNNLFAYLDKFKFAIFSENTNILIIAFDLTLKIFETENYMQIEEINFKDSNIFSNKVNIDNVKIIDIYFINEAEEIMIEFSQSLFTVWDINLIDYANRSSI